MFRDEIELPCGPTVWAVLLLGVLVVACLDSPRLPADRTMRLQAEGVRFVDGGIEVPDWNGMPVDQQNHILSLASDVMSLCGDRWSVEIMSDGRSCGTYDSTGTLWVNGK